MNFIIVIKNILHTYCAQLDLRNLFQLLLIFVFNNNSSSCHFHGLSRLINHRLILSYQITVMNRDQRLYRDILIVNKFKSNLFKYSSIDLYVSITCCLDGILFRSYFASNFLDKSSCCINKYLKERVSFDYVPDCRKFSTMSTAIIQERISVNFL